MLKSTKYRTAVFLSILFLIIVSAPTIIISFDDSVDVSCFFGIGEEEEENENLKLLFDNNLEPLQEFLVNNADVRLIEYKFKTYPKPHLNIIFPPPEFI
ncbi:hypothetical protein [Winogradskyella sp. R77965]|uniref:hypothetical protein n=1 Tax=Winogradskyella sp. R77965 TaxID=3093872 RepID=UPI0037DDE0C2